MVIICIFVCYLAVPRIGRYVDQGGGKRPGAFAIYIEPWHADVFDVLELKKNHGKDELRARYAQFVDSGSANFEQGGGRQGMWYVTLGEGGEGCTQ